VILSILLFLSLSLHAEFTPLPASTPESTNSNFKTIDEEIRRLDSVISSTASAMSGYGALSASNTWSGSNTFANPTSSTTILGFNNMCVLVGVVDTHKTPYVILVDSSSDIDMTSYTYTVKGRGKIFATAWKDFGYTLNGSTEKLWCENGYMLAGNIGYSWGCNALNSLTSYGARLVWANTNAQNGGTFTFETELSTVWGMDGVQNLTRAAWSQPTGSFAGQIVAGGTFVSNQSRFTSIKIGGSSNDFTNATPTFNQSFSIHAELWRCGWKMR